MVKYTKHRKQRKQRRQSKTLRNLRKTRRRILRNKRVGGYSPVGPNGGNYGAEPKGDIVQSNGSLPDPAPSVPY